MNTLSSVLSLNGPSDQVNGRVVDRVDLLHCSQAATNRWSESSPTYSHRFLAVG